ncbi:MAG: hypothetical protein Ta2B_03910 [Termitinemataceae bacterium]|nr:MAG: hypothetical protein Ta2B_03910 [Termitinemataceae bacterium]
MKLSDFIYPELVRLKLPCKNHDELVDSLIKTLYNSEHKIKLEEDVVRNGVTAHETLRGSLLPTGLSIPHARFEGLEQAVIIIGVPEAPIRTARGDTPILMMVLMLIPSSGATRYLNTLSAFAQISQSDLFSKLCSSENPDTFVKLIANENIAIAKELTIASIMNTTIKALHPQNTVKEAMDMFWMDHLGYLPIMDDNGMFVGELTMTDLFSICIPAYALKMQNLKFLSDFQPLEDLLRNENDIRVGDIMKKPTLTLDEDSPVVEAVLKFVQERRRYLPVVKKDSLIGVVGYMDILKKVLRA